MNEAKRRGDAGERMAARALQKKGYRILERNFTAGRHEIDLIAKDGDTVVFVEVKTRSEGGFGLPCEAVTVQKQRFLRLAALSYLKQNNLLERAARFDVVEVYRDSGQIRHIENAF